MGWLRLDKPETDIQYDEKTEVEIILYNDQRSMNERTKDLTENDLIKISREIMNLLLNKIEERRI